MATTNTAGLVIKSTSNEYYTPGDVMLYGTDTTKAMHFGYGDAGLPGITLKSNYDAVFSGVINSTGVISSGPLTITQGGISGVERDYSLDGKIAKNSLTASNHTYLMGDISGVTDWTNLGSTANLTLSFSASNTTFMSNVYANQSLTVARNAICGTSNSSNITPIPLIVYGGSNNVSIYAQYDVSALSDLRKKTDLTVIGDALSKMDEIHGYTFRWIENPDSNSRRSAGVIAQEMEKVVPEVVNSDASGTLSVAYGSISALLIQAIKDLKWSRFAIDVSTASPNETLDIVLPVRSAEIGDPAASKWKHASISRADASAADAYVSISTDGARVVGAATAPGKYTIVAYA